MEALYACVENTRGGGGGNNPLASLDRLRPHPSFDQGSPSAYRMKSSPDGGFTGVLDILARPRRTRRNTDGLREEEEEDVVRPPDGLLSDTYLYLVFSALFPEDLGVLVDVQDIRAAVDIRKQELADAVPRLEADPGVRQNLLRCFRENNTDDRISDRPCAASFVNKYVHETSGGGTTIVDDDASVSSSSSSTTTFLRMSRVTQHDGRRRYIMHVRNQKKSQYAK